VAFIDMNYFRLHMPVVSGQTVRVSWDVEPVSALYWNNEFHLEFPASVDLNRVPDRVWGLIAMLCLHPHWVLLRPCRVELPFAIDDRERELWYRLMEAAITTLAAHAGRTDFDRDVEIRGSGEALSPPSPLAPSARCATAFSGGKDSLLQTGLLTELTEKPVLVAVTSQVPPRVDHLTERRRHVFRAIEARRDVTFVEVQSDFRSAVNYDFSHANAGYPIAATELTDTFLFLGATIATSSALGVPHLFLASEAEVQESVECDGRIVQHRHFMYSAVTLRGVSALLAPYGLQLSSLTSPLYAVQVHRLLWTRYRDLSDLQYSCWMVHQGEGACSKCRPCLEYALGVLALGDRPARMGLELGKVMREVRDWSPRTIDPDNRAPNPSQIASARHSGHIMANARAASPASFLRAMLLDHPRELFSSKGLEAFRCFRELKQRLEPLAPASPPGYRPGFLELVDPLLRDRVGAIYASHFSAEPDHKYADLLARSKRLARWVSEPLSVTGPTA
jgi:hypothetical protein